MFTSVNAVEIFLDRVQSLGRLSELNQGIRICTIGPATAQKVKEYGCSVDLIPEIYQAEGVPAFTDPGALKVAPHYNRL